MSKAARINILKELGIWDRLTSVEKNYIRNTENDVQREQYSLMYIKKYL